jgi:hypothetical protein
MRVAISIIERSWRVNTVCSWDLALQAKQFIQDEMEKARYARGQRLQQKSILTGKFLRRFETPFLSE